MEDDTQSDVITPEDRIWVMVTTIIPARFADRTLPVAHCHQCGDIDPTNPYRLLCMDEHPMTTCVKTLYRTVLAVRDYN